MTDRGGTDGAKNRLSIRFQVCALRTTDGAVWAEWYSGDGEYEHLVTLWIFTCHNVRR